ncbi:ATP-binding cassette domain-containing protein [Yinghuangia aomiensis]
MAAAAHGIKRARVDEVLDLVGLAPVAGVRVGALSTGARGRLGIATALLGDPHTLILDEPSARQDPEGARWLREFLRAYVSQGRTVLVAGHGLAELADCADHVLAMSRGRLWADEAVLDYRARAEGHEVFVRTPRSNASSSCCAPKASPSTCTAARSSASARTAPGSARSRSAQRRAAARAGAARDLRRRRVLHGGGAEPGRHREPGAHRPGPPLPPVRGTRRAPGRPRGRQAGQADQGHGRRLRTPVRPDLRRHLAPEGVIPASAASDPADTDASVSAIPGPAQAVSLVGHPFAAPPPRARRRWLARSSDNDATATDDDARSRTRSDGVNV